MTQQGEVVKLDRKFPLVELADGTRLRCELSATLKKNKADSARTAVIGDLVEVALPEGHDLGMIEKIAPRTTTFVRKDPVDRVLSQTLAANFDRVIIVHPLDFLNMKRLERELVLAHETGAEVMVVLTKEDLIDSEKVLESKVLPVQALAGDSAEVIAISNNDAQSIATLSEKLGENTTSILIGSSGAGKSTLVNALLGENARAVSEVRAGDGKGRHTTVSREILTLPGVRNVRIVDMPGVRGLGLWNAQEGIDSLFSEIDELASKCRFRDCKHESEPGCAVLAAVEEGTLANERLESYRSLTNELAKTTRRRETAHWR